MLKYSLY